HLSQAVLNYRLREGRKCHDPAEEAVRGRKGTDHRQQATDYEFFPHAQVRIRHEEASRDTKDGNKTNQLLAHKPILVLHCREDHYIRQKKGDNSSCAHNFERLSTEEIYIA